MAKLEVVHHKNREMSVDREKLFGITEYLHDHDGFFGIIKQRYSDFQVNEIHSSGKPVHLTSTEVPPLPSEESCTKTSEEIERPDCLSNADIAVLDYISGQKKFNEIKPSDLFVRSTDGKSYEVPSAQLTESTKELKIDVKELDKASRTSLHRYITAHYSTLNSSTVVNGDEKWIHIRKKTSSNVDKRSRAWPKRHKFVHFVLYKENMDTMEAVNRLAGVLRLKASMFGYAGTKDRRAKTSQMVSICQVLPERITGAARTFGARMRVGDFRFASKGIKLGNLFGNRFKIVLREVSGSDLDIDKALESLKENGFVNYYGMQRFGSFSVPTNEIGKAIIKGEWSDAINLILSSNDADNPDMSEAKQIWKESYDAKKALGVLKRSRNSMEGKLLESLSNRGNKNFVTAIEQLPRNLKLLYAHAYQSFIWNSIISMRIRKYGVRVLAGDLILSKSMKGSEPENTNVENEEGLGEEKEESEDVSDDEESFAVKSSDVRYVSEEEVDSIDITQVLMPLPGHSMMYPKNEIGSWYTEVLSEDCITLDHFKNKVKTFSLGGSYRTMVSRPLDVNSSICYYDDPLLPLFASDLEVLKGVDVKSNRLNAGTHKALLLEFSLPSSTYATMALREIMKIDTSSKFQATLNTPSTKEESETTTSNGHKRELQESQISPQSPKRIKCEETEQS